MHHPLDYAVNEAWIVFRLNNAPVSTTRDGDFHIVGLMDAASGYVLGHECFAVGETEVPAPIAEELLEKGKAVAKKLPRKLLLSSTLGTEQFTRLAEALGIEAERVPDRTLKVFLSEVRKVFRKQGF